MIVISISSMYPLQLSVDANLSYVGAPEVAAAKLAHAAAGGLVNPLVYAGYPYAAAYPYAVGVPGALVAHPNGAVVPADTAEVYAAKVAHAAAGGVVNPVGYYGLPYA